MVDGLYVGDSTLTGDFATVAYRIQLLGFNAIRLPFSFLVGPIYLKAQFACSMSSSL